MEIAARWSYGSCLPQLLTVRTVSHATNPETLKKDPMKDIVEDALEYAEQQGGSETVSSDEFGPPQFLYVGIGNRGITRLRLDLSPRGTQSESRQAVESVVTRVAFQSDPDHTPDESNQIDQYVDDLQALADLDTEIDCCFVTADLDDPSVITDILNVANSMQDSLVIAILTTSTDHHRDINRQIHDSVGTTVVIKDADSHFDTIELLENSHRFSTDRLIQRLLSDLIILFVGPNPVTVDYARVWAQWDSGRSAVPFVGKFHQSELNDPDYSSSLSFAGSSSQSSTDWFGYTWVGPSFTLEDFEQFRVSLDSTLRSNSKGRGGILGCGVDEQLEESVFVSGVQFFNSEV